MKGTRAYWDRKGPLKCLLAVVLIIAAILGFANSKTIVSYAKQFFAAGDVPAHSKTLTPNDDGTYQLELTVKGDADTKVETAANVNVLVIYDTSSSMTSNNVTTNPNRNRADYAEDVVHDFIDGLRKYQNESDPSNIQVAVVTFGPDASGNGYPSQSWTSNLTSSGNNAANRFFDDGVDGTITTSNNYTSHNGTNWYAALNRAQTMLNSADEDPTFVVFVTDGAPTAAPGETTINPAGNHQWTDFRPYYNAATTVANQIQSRENTTLFGIYAYGREADLLDDLMYYSNTGSHREINGYNISTCRADQHDFGDTEPTDNYYNAGDTDALNSAITEIFGKIVQALGISSVTIDDGTTNEVEISSNAPLLNVDENSYKYWLEIPLVNNQFQRVDLQSGETITYTATNNNNGTYTITWGENNSVNVKGYPVNGGFKYQWESKNALYNYDPPAAQLVDGHVVWNLSSVDALLDGVTYSVTFDVYPSQDTYDLIAEIKNIEDVEDRKAKYESLPRDVQDYLIPTSTMLTNDGYFDFELKTNTVATLSYTDTRTGESNTTTYEPPINVATTAEEMQITKEWKNYTGDGKDETATINVIQDGEEADPYLSNIELTPQANTQTFFIATGLMKVNKSTGTVEILDTGHDYTFDESGPEDYNWELISETVRPMIINGTLTKLVKLDENVLNIYTEDGTPKYTKPSMSTDYLAQDGKEYYKIDGEIYVAEGTGAATLNATNYRRSNLNISKEVNGIGAPASDKFTYTIDLKDQGATDDLWFSIMKSDGSFDTTQTISGTRVSGDYYVISKSDVLNGVTLTFTLQNGDNLRFTNLTTKTTYTVEETEMPSDYKFESVTAEGTYGDNTEIEDIDAEITGKIVEGSIGLTNSTYEIKYVNEYQKVNIKVIKKWVGDDNDSQGLREAIDVSLIADDEEVDSATIGLDDEGNPLPGTIVKDDGNTWEYTFTGKPKYNNGEVIDYSVTEEIDLTPHYTSSDPTGDLETGFTITNTRNPDDVTVDVEGEKIWEDNNDQDKLRPATITINLLKNGSKIDSKVVNIDPDTGEGKYSWTELPKYENGDEIVYSVTEEAITYYEPEYIKDTYNIKNKHTPFTTLISVTKAWNDNENQDGKRPPSVQVQLFANDGSGKMAYGDPITLSDANEWSHTFDKLPRKKAGVDIEYTIEELTVTDYTPTYAHVELIVQPEGNTNSDSSPLWTVTNNHTPEKVSVKVLKVWDDNNDQDAIRPTSINVQLTADGEPVGDPVTLTEGKEWTNTWTELDKYKDGEEIDYKVDESAVPNGYNKDISVNTAEDGTIEYTITNKHVPEETEATVTKVWDDNNDQDAIRPTSITMQLLADGEPVTGKTVTLNNDKLTETIRKLPKYNHSKTPIEYTWEELEVPTGYEITSNETNGKTTTITNKHVPEETEATVTKVWDDNNDQDAIRPTSITMQLLADGEPVTGKTVTLNNDKLTETIKNLPKYNHSKTAIEYTWEELEVPTGYTITSNVTDGTTTTITNKHVPEETEATVTKVWDDNNDQDAIRPTSITMQLLADGDPVTGKTVTLTNDKLTETIKKLPKYNHSKTPIEYTWEEVDVPAGYEITSNETNGTTTTITNKHVPELTEATVTKVWDDNNNQDGIRPTSITMQLLADGDPVTGKTVTLNNDKLTETIKNLPKYNHSKTPIKYSWSESELPKGYTMTSNVTNGTVTTITNTHVTEETSITVTKVWEDANDQDGIRPTSVTVQLLKDGTAEGTPVTLDEDNQWTYTWSGLDKFNDGDEIKYTVKESTTDVITGTDGPGTYKFEVTGSMAAGFKVTNTHTPETVTISGAKTWNDANNQDGLRPSSITINLYADNVLVNSDSFPVDENTGECNYSFTTDSHGVALPKYKNGGDEIVYSITEERVSDYEKPEYDEDDFDVTNTHNPFKTQISVEKIWDDGENVDGKRSKSITVTLQADGITKEVKTLDSSNEWKWTWPDLPRRAGGKEIVYTIKELVVPAGYDSLPEGYEEDSSSEYIPTSTITTDGTTYTNDEVYTMTNKHIPEKVKVFGEKVWDDDNDVDGYRATTVKITLLADGEDTGKYQNISAQDDWKFAFEGLPKYKFDEEGNGGDEIEYTVTEEFSDPGNNYQTEITGSVTEGFTITNKHTPDTTSVTVTKVWDDANDQDGKRPGSIQVQLTADGTPEGQPVTLDEDNEWTTTWTGLKKNKKTDNGEIVEIEYKVDEVEVPKDYTKTIKGDATTGYTITNKWTPETTFVEGTKVWDDSNNVDGKRPATITIYVKDGDTTVDEITVRGDSTAESWTFRSKDLPKYRNHGEKINYTILEETTELAKIGYSTKIDGTTITNSRTPEVVEEFPITKTWVDNSNSEGFRPNSVKIQLLADEKPYGDPVIVGTDKDGNPLEGTTISGNNWKYVFKNLPKYTHDADGNGGKVIVYSIKEVDLDANYKAEQVDNRTIVNTIDEIKKPIPVKKVWDDASDQDGYRPSSIIFTLTGTVPGEEGPQEVYKDEITLSGDNDEWEGEFKEVPTFHLGTLITYTINEVEVKTGDLKEYKQTTAETVDGVYTITNKHVPEITSVTIGKTWKDEDDQDGKRPASIEVTLTGNGKTYGPVKIGLDENGNPLEGTTIEGNTWKYTFDNLPKKANGEDIDYVVSEKAVDNYNQLSIVDNVITNQHIPETISYLVEKDWQDFDNQDGKRPDYITVTLTGKVEGTVVYNSTITVKPDDNGDWKYSFTGLNKYYKGKLIQYTLTEGNVELYETDPIVDVPTEEGTTSIANTIINRHELMTIDITVKKIWDDLDNKYNHRTTFVTVHLFADGEEVDDAILNEANGWTATFTELLRYREGEVGEPIEYTIVEEAVNYYKTSIVDVTDEETGNIDFTITNTYDGPTDSEIVPPKTGILPTKDYTFFELLMNLILLSYSLVYLKKVEN